MEFRGPAAADYENVHSLNLEFLSLLHRDGRSERCLAALPDGLADRLLALSGHQLRRLSRAPFLLMSFGERNERFWEPVFSADPAGDLFALPAESPDSRARLVAAGLAFVWQLARHNPYAARLICGASLHWCEQLTERTVLHVLALAGGRPEVLAIRGAEDAALWAKLLDAGVSRDRGVRRAAQISALQCMLTAASLPPGRRFAAAACAVRAPLMSVAEDSDG